ncbi:MULTISPECIES: hypothetical protein [Pseudomonas]|uniref:Uncharacterized protein n=1 Tax=Pseudomonas fluorescens TaxID=294 RepID=A0A166QMM8_PSEFL|nr:MULTISPECIES: hypothetical protein [Pseudomonas]KZN20539.1 hypothetical protein A1D17_03080 [Pseudomonas fluorescens]
MNSKSALKLALEALTLAAECGGDADHAIYVEAKQKLQALVDEVLEFDATMDREERSPEGDDYNSLLSIIELCVPADWVSEVASQ